MVIQNYPLKRHSRPLTTAKKLAKKKAKTRRSKPNLYQSIPSLREKLVYVLPQKKYSIKIKTTKKLKNKVFEGYAEFESLP